MPAGRPTDLTPEVIEDVRRLLPTVMYLETVADYIGVTRQAIRGWLKRGAKEIKRVRRKPGRRILVAEALYVEFFHAVKKALAAGEIGDAGTIKKASADQWQAAAWRLERRFPDRWGRKDRHEVEHSGSITTEIVEVLADGDGGDATPAGAEGGQPPPSPASVPQE